MNPLVEVIDALHVKQSAAPPVFEGAVPRNWGEYDQALPERGSLTIWVTPEVVAAWYALPTGKRGRSRSYSDVTIETGHLLRLAFGRPWR
jgi:hypothetical protein